MRAIAWLFVFGLIVASAGFLSGCQSAKPKSETGADKISRKLETIVIPKIDFNQVTIVEAVDVLRQVAIEQDIPTHKGVDFVLKLESKAGSAPFSSVTVKMSKVPLRVALDYITQSADLNYRVESDAVIIYNYK